MIMVMSLSTSAKVVNHCDFFKRVAVLTGFTVIDPDVLQVTELLSHHLFGPGPLHLETRFREKEDLVVSLDVQVDVGWIALPGDAGDFKMINGGRFCC